MNAAYEDIRSRIQEKPLWFDSNGTPRYGFFEPEMCPNIYARDVCLVEIACQRCAKHFKVEMHSDRLARRQPDLVSAIQSGTLTYLDPPCHGCSGDCEVSRTVGVLEFWRRLPDDWERVHDLEVVFA